MTKRSVCTLLLWVAITGTASAQLITIRTVPVSPADQGQIFPSQLYGMGGVSIAVADTLLDPFGNPAKGSRVRAAQFLGSPTFYNVSSRAGGGRTLPLGIYGRRQDWFGGAWVALQQVTAARVDAFFPIPLVDVAPQGPLRGTVIDPDGLLDGLDSRTHGNQFAFASVGRILPGTGVSVGGSILWSGLHAVDGVDMLYAGSAGVRQYGHATDLRFGALKEWGNGRSLEAVLLYDRFRMTHDVTYLDFVWDPGLQQSVQRARLDRQLDRTDTWGLHLEYERPLEAQGWRIGWLGTVNYMTHPKIPNYQIMNIPRDPGNSQAYNIGMGLSKTRDGTMFGLDVIYEPIWSHTWADAATPIETGFGDTIPAGGMTIENRFTFSNALLRLGVNTPLSRGEDLAAALQLGLVVRSVSYQLAQYDHVQRSARTLDESWVEWTPTWGLKLGFPSVEIRYQGRLTSGTGRPGVQDNDPTVLERAAPAGGGIIAAPSGPLQLGDVRVMTHQVSISLPLR